MGRRSRPRARPSRVRRDPDERRGAHGLRSAARRLVPGVVPEGRVARSRARTDARGLRTPPRELRSAEIAEVMTRAVPRVAFVNGGILGLLSYANWVRDAFDGGRD